MSTKQESTSPLCCFHYVELLKSDSIHSLALKTIRFVATFLYLRWSFRVFRSTTFNFYPMSINFTQRESGLFIQQPMPALKWIRSIMVSVALKNINIIKYYGKNPNNSTLNVVSTFYIVEQYSFTINANLCSAFRVHQLLQQW